jgi:hypothetical protein
MFGEEYKLWSRLHPGVSFSLLGSDILVTEIYFETPTNGPVFPSGLRDGPCNVAQGNFFLTVIRSSILYFRNFNFNMMAVT